MIVYIMKCISQAANYLNITYDDARSLFLKTFDISLTQFQSFQPNLVQVKYWQHVVSLLKLQIPINRILNRQFFWKNEFILSAFVLAPRFETEYIVKIALQIYNDKSPSQILDIGVGSGCILLSLAQKFYHAISTGVDISQYAIQNAAYNASLLKITCNLHHISYEKFLQNHKNDHFDLIICNPPYITNINDVHISAMYDPPIALFGNILTYIQIIQNLPSFCHFIAEVPVNLVVDIKSLITNYKIQVFNTNHDKIKILVITNINKS